MAALRDDGHTICHASLKLEIRNPKSETTVLSTENGGIQYSGKCGQNNVTDVPDYFAYYQVGESGTYQMKLTNPDNGYEIEDSFEVRDSVPFNIERIGPTRIYPKADYEMKMIIKANEDFSGKVIESMPAGFVVKSNSHDSFNIYDDSQEIAWNVNWKAGETHELKYTFDAPDISPYLYLLGPLKIGNFQEIRQWQIAADAPDSEGPISPSSASEDTSAGEFSWSGYTNVYSNDGSYALVTLSKNETSYYIKAQNFGFSLPNCSSIDGIYVEVDRYADYGTNNPNLKDYSVRLVNGSGSIVGDNKADTTNNWPTSDDYATYGGSTDSWNAGLTCSDVTNSNFGVVFSAQNTVPTKPYNITAYVDHIRVTVYYTSVNLPAVTGVSLNNSLNIDLTEGTTVLVTSTATITDADGYSDITSATGTIYRSGVTGGANCTADNNNCYKDTSCDLSNCSGNSCTATCDFNVWYYADPTVSGTPWAGEYWVASIGAVDSASNYDDATNTTETILMNDLIALSIIEPSGNIDFGQMADGQDTGTCYVTSTVAATGNVALDTNMSGEGLIRDGGSEMIDVQNQEYSTTTAPYETYGSGTSLTTSTVEFELELAKTADHDSTSTDDIFWGLGVPSGTPLGTYYGTTTIAAVKDELPWPP